MALDRAILQVEVIPITGLALRSRTLKTFFHPTDFADSVVSQLLMFALRGLAGYRRMLVSISIKLLVNRSFNLF